MNKQATIAVLWSYNDGNGVSCLIRTDTIHYKEDPRPAELECNTVPQLKWQEDAEGFPPFPQADQ
jgi:hypothetical protein